MFSCILEMKEKHDPRNVTCVLDRRVTVVMSIDFFFFEIVTVSPWKVSRLCGAKYALESAWIEGLAGSRDQESNVEPFIP